MTFQNIVVCGGGVLGSQIAFQLAFCELNVTVWVRSEESIKRTKLKISEIEKLYLKDLEIFTNNPNYYIYGIIGNKTNLTSEEIELYKNKIKNSANKIKYIIDIKKAVKNADLIIESISEIKEEKNIFYKNLSNLLDEKTILATNTSTFIPSMFANLTGRPKKFLSMHFANIIHRANTLEIMGHSETDKNVINEIIKFAEKINMIPLPINKEQPGYILNTLLGPWLHSAAMLWANEIADAETIDKTWVLGTGSPIGPMKTFDIIGLKTIYNIYQSKKESESDNYKIFLLKIKEMIDNGKTGIESGEGFYKYK